MSKKLDDIYKLYAVDGTVDIPGVEIFKVGHWNKDTYSLTDLAKMVSNFNKLKAKVKPFLKLGHDEEQRFAGGKDKFAKEPDGRPAFGWIDNLRINGDTLIANFKDVPRKLGDLIQKRAYKRVSSEIFPLYESEGNKYEQVLRAVALLGGDVPAVDTLADIPDVFTDKSCQNREVRVYSLLVDKVTRKLCSSQITNGGKMSKLLKSKKAFESVAEFVKGLADGVMLKLNIKEDTTGVFSAYADALASEVEEFMAPDELAKAMKGASGKDDTNTDELKKKCSDLEAKVATLTGEVETYKSKAKVAEEKIGKMTSDTKEKEIRVFVNQLKTDGKIFAKQEEEVYAILMRCDETKVVKTFKKDEKDITVSELEATKEYFSKQPKIAIFTELGPDGNISIKTEVTDAHGKVTPIKDAELDMKAKQFSKEHNVSYEKALLEVSKS